MNKQTKNILIAVGVIGGVIVLYKMFNKPNKQIAKNIDTTLINRVKSGEKVSNVLENKQYNLPLSTSRRISNM